MIGWRYFWILFYLYRCACSVLGQIVVVQLTTLGDSMRFQGNAEKFGTTSGLNWLLESTQVTEAVGLVLAKVLAGNAIAINVGFQTLAFYGIYRFLRAVPPRLRRFVALMMLAPSFNLWTSVASKEAIIVFAAGIACGYIVELYRNTARLGPLHVLSGLILAVFKPHYLVSLGFIYLATQSSRFVRQKEALLLIAGVLSVSGLYVFRDTVDDLSFQIIVHFLTDAGFSTRGAFWVEPYDVFWRAPYGMLLSFVGPTFAEALANPLQMVSLVESVALLVLIVIYLIIQLPRMPVYCLLMSLFAAFWLMFANYPFGVMNPGSAIRYRAGYYIVFITALLVLTSREIFQQWQSRVPSGPRRRGRFRLGPRITLRPSVRLVWQGRGGTG